MNYLEIVRQAVKRKICIRCKDQYSIQKLYKLSDGRVACGNCGYKYSTNKIAYHLDILEDFAKKRKALHIIKLQNLEYNTTVNTDYRKFREILFRYSQSQLKKLGFIDNKIIYLEEKPLQPPIPPIFFGSILKDCYSYFLLPNHGVNYNDFNGYIVSIRHAGIVYHSDSRYNHRNYTLIPSAKSDEYSIWDDFIDLVKYYGGFKPRNHYLYLKEAEARYNFGDGSDKLKEILVKEYFRKQLYFK